MIVYGQVIFMYTIESRKLFFDFLVKNGYFTPQVLKGVIEVAPNVPLSLSRLLVEKYGQRVRQLLISENFEYGNIFNVEGAIGKVYLHNSQTANILHQRFPNQRIKNTCFSAIVEGSFGNHESLASHATITQDMVGLHTFETKNFDTLLIQGDPQTAFALATSGLDKLFGDVCTIADTETREVYESLYWFMFDYCKDEEVYFDRKIDEENGKECNLIYSRKKHHY